MTTNFGGVDVVPLITQKLVFAIWGLCWYNLFSFLPFGSTILGLPDEKLSYQGLEASWIPIFPQGSHIEGKGAKRFTSP